MSVSPTTFNNGGAAITNCALSSGSLPSGLSVNTSTCNISGVPASIGTFSASIIATNSVGPSPAASVSLTVSSSIGFQGYAGSHLPQTNSGNTLIVLVVSQVTPPSVPPSTVTLRDTAGNTFTQVSGPNAINNSNFTVGTQIASYVFYSENIVGSSFSSGGDDISIVGSTSWSSGWNNGSPCIASFEFSGIAAKAPDFVVSTTGNGTALSTPSGSATEVGELLFAVGVSDSPYTGSGTPISAGPGFGQLNYNFTNDGSWLAEMESAQNLGPQTATFTSATSTNWAAILIGFKY